MVLLAAIVVAACGGTTIGPGIQKLAAPSPAASPDGAPRSLAASASSTSASFRRKVTDAIAGLEDPWALFCVTRGQIVGAMPAPKDLLKFDADPRISSATDILINLSAPAKGWLEVTNAAKAVGIGAADATLADILIRAQLKQGASPSDLEAAWSVEVLAPCEAVRVEIEHVKELLDMSP